MKLHCGLVLVSSKHELRLFGHHNRVKQQQVLELNQGIDKVVPQLKREITYLFYYRTKFKKKNPRPRYLYNCKLDCKYVFEKKTINHVCGKLVNF